MEIIRVRTEQRSQLIDITRQVSAVVAASGVRAGVAVAQSLHTTAALTIISGVCRSPV